MEFLDPGELVDGDLRLVMVQAYPGDPSKGYVPAYAFEMRHSDTDVTMGMIRLRIGSTPELELYRGHIGYEVEEGFRGNRYAARACKLVRPLAAKHGLKILWITTNVDNEASRRTCELAGAEFVEIVDIPAEELPFHQGATQKCRFRF